MSFVFNPGNLVVDEASTFGQVHAGSDVPQWPDSALWQERVRHWLTQLSTTRVGSIVLEMLQQRPAAGGTLMQIVRKPAPFDQAFTDNITIPPDPASAAGFQPATSVTYTPSDAVPGPRRTGPMLDPGPVLLHELTHALMGLNGLSSVTVGTEVRPIVAWQAPSYPSFNEFCATTIQNMLLSETGSQLADGYNRELDDPWISSEPLWDAEPTGFGFAATTRVDMANFVNSYRQPLEYLEAGLPGLTTRLAALSDIAFNPFAFMRTADGSGSTETSGGASGAARVPGPVEVPVP